MTNSVFSLLSTVLLEHVPRFFTSALSGKIFGSVTNVQIVQALKDQFEVDLDRREVILPEDVKGLGSYKATLNLHPEVQAELALRLCRNRFQVPDSCFMDRVRTLFLS